MKCNPCVGGSIGRRGFPMLGTGKRALSTYIKDIFSKGEQGFTQIPSDLSTLYQDAAGTTPVTAAGQVLGLVLDKSKGLALGTERLTNWDFSAGSTGWTTAGIDATHIITFSNGTVRYQSDTITPALSLVQSNAFVTGKWYEVTTVCSEYISGAVKIDAGNGSIPIASSAGTTKIKILATSTTSLIITRNSANVDLTLDSVSVKELAGSHAYQSTSSYRPLLQASPQRIVFDGIDDKLTTTLAAQLTGCTVIRAIPNVGCQILTNQTIPTPYNDSTNHCGLIVINRALTAYETSTITQLFNKLAGV